jgi:hypothetical protein
MRISFKQFIRERFVNILDDWRLKEKYARQVWDILQQSYADIGGIKGNGFNNVDDMIKIPFWKLVMKDGIVHGVVMYKDKDGRKSVAAGTDGSSYGKIRVTQIMQDDVLRGRAYAEVSKASLGIKMKHIPWDILEPFMMTPEQARQVSGKEIIGVDQYDGELPSDAVFTLDRYPKLKPYAYLRKIAGEYTFKVMLGTAGNTIR